MKKLLSIAVCASAVAASAADVPVTLGQVGVTAITSSTTNTIVAVSYTDLASDGNITASNLVKTANLTVGDHLYVYKGNNSMDAFELDVAGGVKYWKPSSVVSPMADGVSISASSSADSVTVPVGSGVWLVRGSGYTGGSFTFYIYGKPASPAAVSVTAETSALVGNPTQTDKAPTFTVGPNNNDKILVPHNGSATGMRTWTYSSTKKLWWYKEGGNRTFQAAAPTIPAGSGFWYAAAGAVTFNW